MSYILIFLSAFILGVLACPIVLFLRARKCDQWDGSKPFWYLLGDEFADIVKSRPKER